MTNSRFDVIIIGAGGAGLSAAYEAAKLGARVAVVTRGLHDGVKSQWRYDGGCTWKTHAFNAAISEGDSVQAHVNDTFSGGGRAGRLDLIQTLCDGAIQLVSWLEKLGVSFDTDFGSCVLRPFGGNGVARGVFVEDRLGMHIQRALVRAVYEMEDKVTVLRDCRLLDLLQNCNGSVAGVRVMDQHSLGICDIRSRSVILADGGGAAMYQPSAVSRDKTCAGLGAALRAGAVVVDMEFVQFHPTGLMSDNILLEGSLVEEAVRFDGAQLFNSLDERFMFKYDKRGEQATRDIVSRGIYSEIKSGNGIGVGGVRLDLSKCETSLANIYPAMGERFHLAGYDLREKPSVLIRPTAHFMMGGIEIDTRCRTSVTGLFAAGETAGGVHGANRLGGNGLSEALVFGRIAGMEATACTTEFSAITAPRSASSYWCGYGNPAPAEMLLNLRQRMYDLCGPIRDEAGLKNILKFVRDNRDKRTELTGASGAAATFLVQDLLDLEDLLLASEMVVAAALERRESRGSHYRSDYLNHDENFIPIRFTMAPDHTLELSSSRSPKEVFNYG